VVLVAVLAAAVIALASPGGAAAKSWPTPAAGDTTSGGPEILFTFDDGPNPKTTPLVLDTLARHHIHAVFFMVGEMAENKSPKVAALIRRVLREGHVIASHTMKHKDLCRVPADVAAADIDDGKAAVEAAAGVPTAWFRVPFGVRCDRLEHLLAERHLVHFHWDLDPQEWKHGDATRAVRYVTGEIGRAYGRDVLLMHDIKQATVKALPQILDWIDAENARRVKSHGKRIRILQAPALAVERLPRGLGAWLSEATAGARALPRALASVLP
jgi:peptidoglycan/xylan/chitin deacetylase (PgdA/CDA1 family)